MNTNAIAHQIQTSPLKEAVRVCVFCNPGKQAENYLCPQCEAELSGAGLSQKINAELIQAETWDERIKCDGCFYQNHHGLGKVICGACCKPEACPAVSDAIDVVALALSVPAVMADFLSESSHQEEIAQALIAECGNTSLKQRLLPLINRWSESQSQFTRDIYVSAGYGDTQKPIAAQGNSKNPASVHAIPR